MKTSKLIRLIAVLMLTVLASACFAACGSGSTYSTGTTENQTADNNSSNEPLYNINGVDVTSVGVEMVGETPNLMIIFSNTSDKDIDVDISQLMVKLSDGTEIGNFGLSRTIEANKPYSRHALTIPEKYGIKLGDTVEVYYGDDKLASVEVTEF